MIGRPIRRLPFRGRRRRVGTPRVVRTGDVTARRPRGDGAVRSIFRDRENWSGRWDSNPRPQPWQGCALPLSYARIHASGRAGAAASMHHHGGDCNTLRPAFSAPVRAGGQGRGDRRRSAYPLVGQTPAERASAAKVAGCNSGCSAHRTASTGAPGARRFDRCGVLCHTPVVNVQARRSSSCPWNRTSPSCSAATPPSIAKIHDALAHPSVDEVQMTELKRKKLALKEQIERLKAPMSVH